MGRALKVEATVETIGRALGLQVEGVAARVIGASAIGQVRAGELTFLKSRKYLDQVRKGAIVVTTAELAAAVVEGGASVLLSANPRLDFARALAWLEEGFGFVWSEAEPLVHPTASIGRNVVLGPGVRIGAHTRVLHNAVIGAEVSIGERCIVKSCAVIGEEGFGFERDDQGSAVRLPHLGGVIIEDDVEVGSLTTVCRGTLGDTLLKRGSKIDDHVHIAHNVVVGRDALVIACAEVSGGVVLGDSSWIAPSASIKNQVTIGERTVIGLGAVVLKDVPADQVIVGNPGKPLTK